MTEESISQQTIQWHLRDRVVRKRRPELGSGTVIWVGPCEPHERHETDFGKVRVQWDRSGRSSLLDAMALGPERVQENHLHDSSRDWPGHVRGPDGYLTPYGDEETRGLVAHNAEHVAGCQPSTQGQLPGGLLLSCYLFPDEPYSMGPRLYWTVTGPSARVIAAGVVERDLDWEEEQQELAGHARSSWISQGAFVLPEYQRQGIYSNVLGEIRRLTGCPLLPDTQLTRASSGCWKKLAVEFGFNPDEVPLRTN
jgi:hypothetical protein